MTSADARSSTTGPGQAPPGHAAAPHATAPPAVTGATALPRPTGSASSLATIGPILRLTFRGLLNRRRIVLMALLAFSPVLVALLVRVGGRDTRPVTIALNLIDGLVVRTVLPLVALVLGTAALGAELDDGTAVYLLAKPIPRWVIVLAKLIAAAGLTALLIVPAVVLTALILAADRPDGVPVAIAYGIASAVGCAMYVSVFLALSLATGRALIVGLIYTLIWEGLLAGLFIGSRAFSIREYTIGIASFLDPADIQSQIDVLTTAVGTVAVLGLSFFLATRWLQAYQVRGAD